MHRTDTYAGQHGDGGLGDHRHIHGDAIAFFGAIGFQHIGEFTDIFMQFSITDMALLIRFIAFPDYGCLITAFGQMPVKTICRCIQAAIGKPVDVQVLGVI